MAICFGQRDSCIIPIFFNGPHFSAICGTSLTWDIFGQLMRLLFQSDAAGDQKGSRLHCLICPGVPSTVLGVERPLNPYESDPEICIDCEPTTSSGRSDRSSVYTRSGILTQASAAINPVSSIEESTKKAELLPLINHKEYHIDDAIFCSGSRNSPEEPDRKQVVDLESEQRQLFVHNSAVHCGRAITNKIYRSPRCRSTERLFC